MALLREAADHLGVDADNGLETARRAHRLLVEQIGPHEVEEDRLLYPVIANALGGTDPTGTMSRAHAEIAKLTAQLGMILDRLQGGSPPPSDVRQMQRLLYGLYALLELHFAQEDESFLSLADDASVAQQ